MNTSEPHPNTALTRAYIGDLIYLSLSDENIDGYFTWSPCECCKIPFGGMRYTHNLKRTLKDKEIITIDLCIACTDALQDLR